ncbi:MAG: pyridoxamine 5'-phosphate oxidase family protein [Oscillospiraceae bacterium]|nr:pyridoxamine 5'-phosphate oxidase family protein [Oscillospiraceae bacterium]MDY2846756.1 pyridoxamine 5'-phosphate oxidase family protein [Oscillospiraceae bacterium]
MRRKDREMSEEFALKVFDSCEYAVMSMTDEKGLPYCLPMSLARDGEYIYFHCAEEGTKIDILRKHPDVCITCAVNVHNAVDKFTVYYESAVIRGKAEEVTDRNEKIRGLNAICLKFTPSNMADFDNAIERSIGRTAVWKIRIEEITGKKKAMPIK